MTLPRSFSFAQLEAADLISMAEYRGGSAGNVSDDPIARLLPVGNAGGIRFRGQRNSPSIVVLLATRQEPRWPDAYDSETKLLTYFGDNKTPGRGVLETPRGGNEVLRTVFEMEARNATLPLILAFESTGVGRDRIFLGTAHPLRGGLTVEIFSDDDRQFDNYRAVLAVDHATMISRKHLNELMR